MRTLSRWLRRSGWLVVLLALVCIGAGCSTFNRDWKAAKKSGPATGSVEGAWEGTWLSGHNGHTGRLRCLLTKLPDGKYEARFHAKYMKVLGYKSTALFDLKPEGDGFHLTGDADLGMFGTYHYEGKTTPTTFNCTYKCSYDHGTFSMSRP